MNKIKFFKLAIMFLVTLVLASCNGTSQNSATTSSSQLQSYINSLAFTPSTQGKQLATSGTNQQSFTTQGGITINSIDINYYSGVNCSESLVSTNTLNGNVETPVIPLAGTYTSTNSSNSALCGNYVSSYSANSGCAGLYSDMQTGKMRSMQFVYNINDGHGGVVEETSGCMYNAATQIGETTGVEGVANWTDLTTTGACLVSGACGFSQPYSITLTEPVIAPNLTEFSLNGTIGSIVESTITVAMPYGTTDVTGLIATFSSTGESVTVNDVIQSSGSTSNNFTNPVTYTVHAFNGSTKDYVVTVTIQPILVQPTGVTINGDHAFLTSNVSSNITQCLVDESGLFSNCVNLDLGSKLPNGALSISIAESSVTSFATIIGSGATEGASPVVVSCPIKVDGTLDNVNCTSTTITPPSGLNVSQRTNLATNLTTIALNNASDLITSYSIKVKDGVIMAGVIDQTAHSIRVTVPYGVSLDGLVASFTVNGAKTKVKVNNVTQVSGVTANNFSSGLVYAVTPSGGSTVYYSVSVQNSNFAASALNTNNWTETILFSYMPWFVTEQPFNPSAAYGYYKESAPFDMMGLSSIAYTTLNPTARLPMYTFTNIESSLTYTCNMGGITNIDITKCVNTNYINNPSSVAFMGAAMYSTIFYVASYSDNKVIPCASDGTTTRCGTTFTSLPEISNVGLNYPRGMSYKASTGLLTIVNDGDNSYVSCKFGSSNGTTVTCTKHQFQ